jgi:hypothetical protein
VRAQFDPSFTGPGSLPAKLRDWLVDHLADALLGVANDLVVDTASMTALGRRSELVKDVVDFAADEDVHHLCYFTQERTAEALRRWLDA